MTSLGARGAPVIAAMWPYGLARIRRASPVRAAVACLALALASCVSVPSPTLSVAELGSYKLTGVEIQGVEVIRSWPAQEQAWLASGKADPEIAQRLPNESASNFPALRAQFLAALQPRFASAFNDGPGTV